MAGEARELVSAIRLQTLRRSPTDLGSLPSLLGSVGDPESFSCFVVDPVLGWCWDDFAFPQVTGDVVEFRFNV